MNEIFSSNRFFMLLKKELTERTSIIIKFAGIFSLTLLGYWITLLFLDVEPSCIPARTHFIFFGTFITSVTAPFNLYKSYNHPKKGVDYVLLPASATEKFLSMQVMCVIIAPLFILLSALLTDLILATIAPSAFNGASILSLFLNTPWDNVGETLILQQGCILGNLVFQKNKIFKTLISSALIYIGFALFIGLLIVILYKEQINLLQSTGDSFTFNFSSTKGFYGGIDKQPEILPFLKYLIYSVYYVVFPIFFIGGSYYKLKKQQY